MSDLNTLSPVEFDTELAAHWNTYYDLDSKFRRVRESAFYSAKAKRVYGRGAAQWSMTLAEALEALYAVANDESAHSWDREAAQKAYDKVGHAQAAIDEIRATIRIYNETFKARGGWTRGYLVTDGHVHSSMDCSTCNNGEYETQFTWLVEFSGKTEAEVVEAAANRACTICYPSAPVETAGDSLLMTPDERTRAEKRDDAAKAKAERQAKRIAKGLTADGSEFVCSYVDQHAREQVRQPDGTFVSVPKPRARNEYFKTEVAASQWVVRYGTWDNGLDGEKAPAFNAIIEAVAAKHDRPVDEVRAEFLAKIAKKRKQEGYAD